MSPGIELVDVTSGYRRGEYVLKSVSMRMESDTVILGPNGSGKTTLFRAVLGLTPHKRGRILIDGVEVESIRGRQGLVAANLPEVFIGSRLPVRDLAALYLDLLGGDFDYFVDILDRFDARDALGRRIYHLSAGLRKIVHNAIALASKCRYVLLDEPFENLDPARRVAMLKEIVGSRGVKVVNTHMTWMIKHLSEWGVYIMVEGRAYGPLKAPDLSELRISREGVGDTVLSIRLRGGTEVYLSRSTGTPLSSLDSLDKLYEVLTWGS